MNDFFTASSRSIKVGDIAVHQLQVHNFDEWSGIAQVIKDFLSNHPDETMQKVFEAHPFESTQLIAYSLNYSDEQTVELFKQGDTANCQLLNAVIKVNDAFFSEPKQKHRDDVDPRKKTVGMTYFNCLCRMVIQMTASCR